MTIRAATTAAELSSALSASSPGDEILLSPGHYGSVVIKDTFADFVTIRSSFPGNPAVFTGLRFEGAKHIRAKHLLCRSTSIGSSGSAVVWIRLGSSHIEFIESEVHAVIDRANKVYGIYGIYVKEADYTLVDGCHVHDVGVGILGFQGTGQRFTRNFVDHVGSDDFKFAGIDNFLIENNTIGGHCYPTPTAHADFIQFQGASRDGVVRGTVAIARNSERPQGIFMADANYDRNLIEQNIIFTGKVNAIRAGGPTHGGGNIVRNNTALKTPGLGHDVAAITGPAGTVFENNISTATTGSLSGSNLKVQCEDPSKPYHYNSVFVGGAKPMGEFELRDMVPIPGSAADGRGAHARLLEVLGDPTPVPDPIPDPDPTPEPEPEPEPTPDPTPEPTPMQELYRRLTETVFTGSSSEIINMAPDPTLQVSAATVRVRFAVANVSGTKGILCKDASGAGEHFSVYLDDSTLKARCQTSAGGEVALQKAGIVAGQTYDAVISFDGAFANLWVDGVAVDTNATTMDWQNNVEWLQVGGLGWSSASGASTTVSPFSGTIHEAAVYAGAWSPQQLDEPAPEPDPTPEELIAQLEAMIAQLQADIAALEAQTTQDQQTIASLDGQLATANTKIAAALDALS